jgi:hypothetical protein
MENHMKPIAEMSSDTRAVYDRLKKTEVGGIVTYAELDAMTMRKTQGKDRFVVSTAVRNSLRDGMVFAAVRNVGVKRLADTEIVSTAHETLPRIRRAARRASRKLTAVQNFDALPNDAKIQHNTFLSVFGAIAHLGTESATAKVEQKVREASQTLSLGKTLEAFTN